MSDLCPVSVVQDLVEDEYQPETACESHLLFLKQKKYCDVTFIFPNHPNRIAAHEIYLKARSPVFAKIFRMRKCGNVQGNVIQINDSTPEIFQQFLEFIYGDKFEVDIAGALDLLQLSHSYKVRPLTKKCEQLLKTEIPTLESIKVFETARHYGRRELVCRAGQIMVKSFLELVGMNSLANAEEETLVYLLECDELAVKEVGLFQFILDWGRNRVGTSADKELLRNRLKNLISKIRYTNMAPDDFTKVVVPTGLLSTTETILVYSYFCGDDATREGLKTKFNTTRRKGNNGEKLTKIVDFYSDQIDRLESFSAISKQSLSFKVEKVQVDTKRWTDYFQEKAAITEIHFEWPDVNSDYRDHHVLNFNASIGEYSGPLKEGNLTIRFHKQLSNCKRGRWDQIYVEPPVKLIPGMTYSITIEDAPTAGLNKSFRNEPNVYSGIFFEGMNREANVNLEDDCMTLKEIRRKTDYYAQKLPPCSQELAVIVGISIGLV